MESPSPFLCPLCTRRTLDIFPSQRLILDALLERLARFHGTVLDVGCGDQPYKPLLLAGPSTAERYIGLDLSSSGYAAHDLEWDARHIPLEANSVDCALATEVFEHCPEPEHVMREIARVLKPRGFLFFTVPFVWPLHCSPHDQYRFTPFALERHLRQAGFDQIEMKAMGGWDASLAQMIGLWVRRRPMARRIRSVLSICFVPLVRYLLKRDKPQPVFTDQTMITGIAGSAVKGTL
jgi:SAM-dependent methyltransferase